MKMSLQAIAAYKNQDKSAADAIRDFNIPRQTFSIDWVEKSPRNKAHEKNQLLSHADVNEGAQNSAGR